MEQSYFLLTDGKTTIRAYYREGESVLAAIQRVSRFSSPCYGQGICGRCIVEIERPDGSWKKDLACRYPVGTASVRIPLVRPIIPAFEE